MKNIISPILLLLYSGATLSQDKIFLTEDLVKKVLLNSPPSVKQIEANYLTIKHDELSKNDQLSFSLESKGTYYRSKEKLLSNFDGGVTEKSSMYSLGITKPTRYGIDLGVKVFGKKSTNSFIRDAATTGIAASLTMDLYQNFLGRKTNSDLMKSQMTTKRAKLEKEASLKSFEMSVRKLYWAIVSNNEQLNLLKAQVILSEKQYKESLRRRKSNAADAGEVARYRSQWSTRKSNVFSLKYKHRDLIKSLKELIPEFNGKEVVLGSYSIEDITSQVLACTKTIGTLKNVPYQLTPYDDIVKLLNQEERLATKITETYDDAKVSFIGEYASTGRDFGIGNARTNFFDDSRARTSVGFQLSIPLGNSKKNTKEVAQSIVRKTYQFQAENNLSKIEAFHFETRGMVSYLKDILSSQKETNLYLGKSLESSRKKYRQARISVQELINEQDSLLQSRVSEINTNLTILNTLLDYISIFSDTPCPMNRI
jgi:hypothetical protein